jgi:hypothetical protein
MTVPMIEQASTRKNQAGWRTSLISIQWLSFFSWFRQIRGDESLTKLRDPFSLRFMAE